MEEQEAQKLSVTIPEDEATCEIHYGKKRELK